MIHLSLVVSAEAGVAVQMPAFGEALGRFEIVDFRPRERRRKDGSTEKSQAYRLQAPFSGRQRLPPLRIEFVDERQAGGAPQVDAKGHDHLNELLTEELIIEIASVLPQGATIDELRPARGRLRPRGLTLLYRYWPVVLLPLFAAAAFIWWRRLQQQRATRLRVSAYDVAIGKLAQLRERGLPGPDNPTLVDTWYVVLSDVIRRYLEDRYAVRAPELTTLEFLQEARRTGHLTNAHRGLLSDFLEGCDRVKFAGFCPDVATSRQALAAAERFLKETQAGG